MARRRFRGDCTVGTLERILGIPAGTFRHPNGRDMRSDMTLKTLRKMALKQK